MEATESSNGLCRLCASLFCSKSGFFIFGDSHITSKIELYLQIQLVEDDFLPKNICSNCLSKIESFHEFAENARKIQHSFHIYNDTNVFEVHQDENFIHRLETLGKVDSYNLHAKEEQQFNLPSANFGSTFNNGTCDSEDNFLNFFQNKSVTPAESYNEIVVLPCESNSKTMSKLEQENNRGSGISIIKPIDMKHLTTPSEPQPNLFNIPITPPHMFNTSPIVLDYSFSDDVMGSSYLDISSYPDMSEMEDLNLSYKNSIKFEMGKQCGDAASFDVPVTPFSSPGPSVISAEPPISDHNEYFSNLEYKNKEILKYPELAEFDIQNVDRQTPRCIETRSTSVQNLANPSQEVMKCSLPMSSESKPLDSLPIMSNSLENKPLESLESSVASYFPSLLDTWDDHITTVQTNSTLIPDEFHVDTDITVTNESIAYDVIYLGDELFANDDKTEMGGNSPKTNDTHDGRIEAEVLKGNGSQKTSVLRNRLLNMQKEKDTEVYQVITLTEDTISVNTTPEGCSSTTANVHSSLSYTKSILPNETTPSKTPTIQCKSLDKMLKSMQMAQPSIQCKSLDKIIKDMKIANRLSKLQKQNSTNSDSDKASETSSKIRDKQLFEVKKKSLNKSSHLHIQVMDLVDQGEEATIIENVDNAQVALKNTECSYPTTVSADIETNSCNVHEEDNMGETNIIPSAISEATHVDELQNVPVSRIMDDTNIDKEKCIQERIVDLRKSKTKSTNKTSNEKISANVVDSNKNIDKDSEDRTTSNDESWKHIRCDKCQQVYPSKSKFDAHCKSTHRAPPVYTCLCCSKSTTFYATFKSHCYRRNNKNRYRCDYLNCHKSFNSKTCVATHIKHVHLKVTGQKFVCEVCGSMFPSKTELNCHLPCNQIVTTVCQTCGKIFPSAQKLKDHVRRIHSSNTFICDLCAKSFSIKFNLIQHIKTHTSNRPHSCPHCGKSYHERSHLRLHMAKHITTRNFKCHQCNKRFKSETLRKIHEKTHVLLRPAQCEFCPKSFLTVTKLQEHTNIHTGDRPYSCKFCDLSFSNYPNWYKHMKRKHPDFPYTNRKIALSGRGLQEPNSDDSVPHTVEIVHDSSPLLDIPSNTVDSLDNIRIQYTIPVSKMDSLDIILDSGNSNSSSCNMYATSMNMFQTTEYSFHQF